MLPEITYIPHFGTRPANAHFRGWQSNFCTGRAQAADPSPKRRPTLTLNFTHHHSPTNGNESTQWERANKAQDCGRIDARSKYPTPTKGKQPCLYKHPVQGVGHGSCGISSMHMSWEGTCSTERACPPAFHFFQEDTST